MIFKRNFKPISATTLNRILIVVIVLLALTAGYFFTANQKLMEALEKNYIEIPIH